MRQAKHQAETKPSTSTSSTREEEKESSSSSLEQSRQEPSLASTLRDLGVFLLAPSKREATAAALEAAGVTAADLLALAEFVGESEPEAAKRRRYLASVLVDAGVAKRAIDDVRAHQAHEAARAKPEPSTGPTDAEFGAAIRAANQRSVEQFERDWDAYVAQRAAAGRPLAGPREPHAWEVRTIDRPKIAEVKS